jgi:hypothetical protein
LQERFRRGYDIYTCDGFILKEGRSHITEQSVLWGWVAGFSLMMVLVGCAGTERIPAGKSRYDRLGRNSSISSVVDPLVVNVAADTRINGWFATFDIRKLKGYFVDQVCTTRGGPCIYSG